MPTLAAQTVLRVSSRKAATAAHVLIWPTAAPLVRNSHRGWAPKALCRSARACRGVIRFEFLRALPMCRLHERFTHISHFIRSTFTALRRA